MVHDLMMPFNKTEGELSLSDLNGRLKELIQAGKDVLRKAGVSDDKMVIRPRADMKYFDQFRPIPVEIGSEEISDFEQLKEEFHRAMMSNYGYDLPRGFPVEIEVSDLRVQAVGEIETVEFKRLENGAEGDVKRALKEKRKVYFSEAEDFMETAIYERGNLCKGDVIEGPAIIEQPDSTTVMPPGSRCSVDAYGNLIIKQP
jgi:N-methylhydantoinase A